MLLSNLIAFLASKGLSTSVLNPNLLEIQDLNLKIESLNSLTNSQKNDITFVVKDSKIDDLSKSQATYLLISDKVLNTYKQQDYFKDNKFIFILVANPYLAYAYLSQLFYPLTQLETKIHPSAIINPDVQLGANLAIGANVVIDKGCVIGDGAQIFPNVCLEEGVQIGANCRLEAGVVVGHSCVLKDRVIIKAGAVIGGDGFGNANTQADFGGEWIKIHHKGKVIIGNDVRVGNNSCIDRGTFEDTIIEDGCVIDNLVHIAHNVQIGRKSALAASTIIAGSAKIGERTQCAGQVGIVGNIETSDGCVFMGKTGVTHDITQPGVYGGFPAVDVRSWRKTTVLIKQLSKFYDKVRLLEKK